MPWHQNPVGIPDTSDCHHSSFLVRLSPCGGFISLQQQCRRLRVAGGLLMAQVDQENGKKSAIHTTPCTFGPTDSISLTHQHKSPHNSPGLASTTLPSCTLLPSKLGTLWPATASTGCAAGNPGYCIQQLMPQSFSLHCCDAGHLQAAASGHWPGPLCYCQ